jgi:hypothetical protein
VRNTILMVLIAVASGSATAEWSKVSENGFDARYADVSTIERKGDLVQMSNLRDFDRIQELGNGKQYLSRKANWEYDCKNDQARPRQVYWYSERLGAGEVVASDVDPISWRLVVPGTQMHLLWSIACGKQARVMQ